jgi:type III pantothenate kinase
MTRLLLLDQGNTNLKVGLADSRGIVASFSLPTALEETADSLGLKLLELCRTEGFEPGRITLAVASSVVPPLDPLLRAAVRRFLRAEVRFAPGELPLALENRYEKPQEVGADRLAVCFGARRLNPGPPLVVIDFGTATTFDCVSGNAYLGGLIGPGLFSSLAALAGRTAKLPRIALDEDDGELSIGKSTADCLRQGFLHGFAAMAEGLVRILAAQLGPDTRVVATGGFAEVLAKRCPAIHEVRPDLLLEGLRLAALEYLQSQP